MVYFIFFLEKGHLNWFDSKSTIVVGVCVKSKKWCAFLLMLEDCRRSFGLRFVQRSNNSENISRGVRGLDVPLVDKEN